MRLFAIYRPVLREIPRKTGLFLCFHGFFRLFSFPGLFWTLHVFQHRRFTSSFAAALPFCGFGGITVMFFMFLPLSDYKCIRLALPDRRNASPQQLAQTPCVSAVLYIAFRNRADLHDGFFCRLLLQMSPG